MARARVESATLYLHGHPVGHLWSSHGTHRFELSDEYRQTPRRPVLGQVFEERPRHRWKQAQRLPRWFSNLLPEHSRLRRIIAEQHEINHRNEFRLLMALGADLPGALQVIPDRDAPGVEHVSGSDVPTDGGAGVLERQNTRTGVSDVSKIRFSLAGVQLKLSMMWSGNTLMLPGAGELGNHLVKLPSRHYAGVPENEFAMMKWAGATGINVPDCETRPTGDLGPLPPGFDLIEGATVYVVRRFDRGPYGSNQDQRINMEDLNQVLDNWPEAKYEGASYERLGRIILTLCGEEDFLEYVRRLTFCIGIGNEDAHLKNWTIWYPDRIRPRLSPAYDLVSTIQYEELDRGMALKLGGTRRVSLTTLAEMERLADRTGLQPDLVSDTARRTLEAMHRSWQQIGSDLPISNAFRDRLRDYQRSVPLVRPYAI